MSVLNENIGIKIKEVNIMSWGVSSVDVSPRPYHALAFRVKGSACFSHNGTLSVTEPGDVFYMPANYYYSARYKEENEIIVIHFESEIMSEMENFKLSNNHTVSMLFEKIYDIWQTKPAGYYYYALRTMCEILENTALQQATLLKNETSDAFDDAINYMEENFSLSTFSVKEMVKKAHMSDTYFRRLFMERFGTTPAKHLTYRRLSYAERLLSTGRYSVKEAAEMSGYLDVKYFSRIVKKEYGVPPSELYHHKKD